MAVPLLILNLQQKQNKTKTKTKQKQNKTKTYSTNRKDEPINTLQELSAIIDKASTALFEISSVCNLTSPFKTLHGIQSLLPAYIYNFA